MECRIQFHDKSLQDFHWCKLDDSNGKVINSGISNADDITQVCSESSRTVVFFPQQNILLTNPQLPPKASKQQLNAIAYNIEEFLAEDVEDCFFATAPQQSDNTIPVAISSTELMDSWMQFLSNNHINAAVVLPQIYLCPWSDDDDLLASICAIEGGYLLRYGQHAGLFCSEIILDRLLLLLHKQQPSNRTRVVVYDELALSHLDSDSLHLERKESVDLLTQPIEIQSCINLKQKKYQSSNQWIGALKKWQWPIAVLVLLFVVYVAGALLEIWQKDKLYDDIISRQKSVLTQYLPDIEVGSQPKKQLIKAISASRGEAGQVGFLDFLHEYAALKSEFENVDTTKIQFQKSRFIVSLETSDLNSLESFRHKLEKSKFQVQIDNVNINPDKTTGRLIMQEK